MHPSTKSNRASLANQLSLILALLGLFVGTTTTSAQQIAAGGRVPRETYYFAKQSYYEGNYRDALRGAQSALRTGVRIGQRRWIDSVCYYTLLGEINYQQGQFAAALEAHELALQVHMLNPGWMSRLSYPRIGPSKDRVQLKIGWGRRPTAMGRFPDSISSLEGSFDLQTPFELGGPVNPAHSRQVDAVEIFRCLAVSLRRRAELLGDTGPLSNKTAAITGNFANLAAPTGHWVGSWIEVLYGLALLSESQNKSAIGHLASGATAGAFDHPLTGIALLEQGKLHLKKGQFTAAFTSLQQASVAGARYRQADVIEESFRYLTDAFLAAEGRGIFPAIDTAVVYGRTEGFAKLVAGLQMNAAEVAVYANDAASATSFLTASRRIQAPRGLLTTEMGGRLAYLEAITQYRAGNRRAAGQSIKAAVAVMQRTSLPAFHLSIIERLHAAGRRAITPDNAIVLYSRILREPTDNDWRARPLDTIAMLLSNNTGAMERWFELLIDRREYATAMRVAERLRRYRFYSTLPFGGRVLSLRWLLEGDFAMLGKRGMEQKNRLRTKYPELAKGSTEAEKIRLKLAANPLVPQDEAQVTAQKNRVAALRRISDKAENLIHEIALRREPAKLVFPPQPSLSAIKAGMKPNQAILYFVTTKQGWHAWFIRKKHDDYWRIRNPKQVRRGIATLLKSIGNRNGNAAVSAELVTSDVWKQPARGLWKVLVGELPEDGWKGLEELVVVPDGVLWYLPFELLRVPGSQLEGLELVEADANEDVVDEDVVDGEDLEAEKPEGNDVEADDDEVALAQAIDGIDQEVAEEVVEEDNRKDQDADAQLKPGADRTLLSLVRVRYAPVASLSVGDRRGYRAEQKTTVVGGQLFPKESSKHAGEMLKAMKEKVKDVEVISKRKPYGPSRFTAGALQRLIVWSDIKVARSAPYAWSPAQYDRSSGESTLADWIELPWGGPDQLIAPGFHTAAERTLSKKDTGHEIFLTACGLLATGNRTALLSRWRTGGKAPAVLVREFTLGLKEAPASESWQNAVKKVSTETLSAKAEPRITPTDEDEVSASHPFFWGGYMLIDTGAEPTAEQDVPAIPVPDGEKKPDEAGADEAMPEEAGEGEADAKPGDGQKVGEQKSDEGKSNGEKNDGENSDDDGEGRAFDDSELEGLKPLHEDPVDELPKR